MRFDGNLTLVKLEQPLNTYPSSPFVPILITESGIVMLVKPEQFWNALLSILVTESGIVTLVKPAQLVKALAPTVVTVYVTPETTKDGIIVIVPEAEDDTPTAALEEPTV